MLRALCDRATILRGGKVVATCVPAEKSAEEIAEMMIGTRPVPARKAKQKIGDLALSVSGLNSGDVRIPALKVRGGEIVGVAGVAGNGQEALYAVLSGETLAPDAGTINVHGQPVGRLGPGERRLLGAAFVPEERLGHAAVPDFSLIDNTLLSNIQTEGFQRRGLVDWNRTREHSEEICEGYAPAAVPAGAADLGSQGSPSRWRARGEQRHPRGRRPDRPGDVLRPRSGGRPHGIGSGGRHSQHCRDPAGQ